MNKIKFENNSYTYTHILMAFDVNNFNRCDDTDTTVNIKTLLCAG